MSAPKITLEAWAAREFDPPPSDRTLRRWVAEGKIIPKPLLIGRTYWCEPGTKHIAEAEAILRKRLTPQAA